MSSTNGAGALLSIDATRGAPRPRAETPRPLIAEASPPCSGTARSYADASRNSTAPGSSSSRSSDSHATRRRSLLAHSTNRVDFP